jgi:hypothetical protein
VHFVGCSDSTKLFAPKYNLNQMYYIAHSAAGQIPLSNNRKHSPVSRISIISFNKQLIKPIKMEFRHLGRTGLKVSSICLGTMTFGASKMRPGQADEALSHKASSHSITQAPMSPKYGTHNDK